MEVQANLFSNAIEHKERALAHLKAFELEQAWDCLEIAKEIDPYLADLDLLATICQFGRYEKAHAKMPAAKAAQLWHAANDAHYNGSMSPAAVRQWRQWLAARLLAGEFTGTLFCSPKEFFLHRGVCHLALEHWQEAHRDLLDLVTNHPELALPVHWGYFGDAAHALKRWKDANLAYRQVLFTEPHAADLCTLQHSQLRKIFNDLKIETGDENLARALWPFRAWLHNAIEILPGNTFLLPKIQRLRSLLGSELMLERKQSLQQFSFCLCLDQSNLQNQISFDVRIEMKGLESDLFAEYLAEIDCRKRAGI